MRRGGPPLPKGTRLFLGSGDRGPRGIFGALNTHLFPVDLSVIEVEHAYSSYNGAHGDGTWVHAPPDALTYMLVRPAGAAVECDSH